MSKTNPLRVALVPVAVAGELLSLAVEAPLEMLGWRPIVYDWFDQWGLSLLDYRTDINADASPNDQAWSDIALKKAIALQNHEPEP